MRRSKSDITATRGIIRIRTDILSTGLEDVGVVLEPRCHRRLCTSCSPEPDVLVVTCIIVAVVVDNLTPKCPGRRLVGDVLERRIAAQRTAGVVERIDIDGDVG
ncbi:hypothetical protein D3C78_1419280 [compost metagenome]